MYARHRRREGVAVVMRQGIQAVVDPIEKEKIRQCGQRQSPLLDLTGYTRLVGVVDDMENVVRVGGDGVDLAIWRTMGLKEARGQGRHAAVVGGHRLPRSEEIIGLKIELGNVVARQQVEIAAIGRGDHPTPAGVTGVIGIKFFIGQGAIAAVEIQCCQSSRVVLKKLTSIC